MARNPEGRMSLGQHLVELQRRLVVAALAIASMSIGGFFLADFVWSELAAPLMDVASASGRIATINYTSISEAFDTKVSIAVTIGIVAASPVWLWQIWAYITPALVRREKRVALAFLGSAIPIFLGGCVAGWSMLPNIVELMTSFAPEGSTTLLTAKYYLDFSIKFMLAIGAGFVFPVFLVLLNALGLLSSKTIIKGWRWAIIAIFIFTALATPGADVVSMFVLAIPMIAIYFLAALVATIRDRRVAKRAVA